MKIQQFDRHASWTQKIQPLLMLRGFEAIPACTFACECTSADDRKWVCVEQEATYLWWLKKVFIAFFPPEYIQRGEMVSLRDNFRYPLRWWSIQNPLPVSLHRLSCIFLFPSFISLICFPGSLSTPFASSSHGWCFIFYCDSAASFSKSKYLIIWQWMPSSHTPTKLHILYLEWLSLAGLLFISFFPWKFQCLPRTY